MTDILLIVPLNQPYRSLVMDGQPGPDSTLECRLKKLPSVYPGGVLSTGTHVKKKLFERVINDEHAFAFYFGARCRRRLTLHAKYRQYKKGYEELVSEVGRARPQVRLTGAGIS